MRSVYEVIMRPLVTEKSTVAMEQNAYTFAVARDANKPEIQRAVEELFGVHVKNVRTMRFAGKQRRLGRFVGRRAGWKKAVVTLHDGETIEVFEGV
jgi:large subunit ribosomal protein L23